MNVDRAAVNIMIRTLNIIKIGVFERVKSKPALLLTFKEKLHVQGAGRCVTVAGSPVAVPPPFRRSRSRTADGSVCVNLVSFPKRSPISDVHTKTNLGVLGALLKTHVENTEFVQYVVIPWLWRYRCAEFIYCTTLKPQSRRGLGFITVLRFLLEI